MNVRMRVLQWSLVALPLLSAGQPKQLMTSARPSTAQTMSHTATVSEKQAMALPDGESGVLLEESVDVLRTLPLFGERPKTAAQIGEEIHFLNDCDRNFATRAEASDFFADRGWDYVANGQLDTAAYRFNLSWLLNDRNPDAYWGLGVVSYQKNNLSDAIRMLKKGAAISDTNTVLLADLATLQIKQCQAKPDPVMLGEAETNLLHVIAHSPDVATNYQMLSLVNYMKADYDKAWDYFHQAYKLDLSVLDLAFMNDLLAKRPDPKGVFK